jgi:hypothetical protein
MIPGWRDMALPGLGKGKMLRQWSEAEIESA